MQVEDILLQKAKKKKKGRWQRGGCGEDAERRGVMTNMEREEGGWSGGREGS